MEIELRTEVIHYTYNYFNCFIFSGWSHRARIPSHHALEVAFANQDHDNLAARSYSLNVLQGKEEKIQYY